jgi:N-acetyl-anhydromuramyl-L-alanine amidase AmpD
MKSEDIDMIVVHCAATKPEMDIGYAEIDQWHKDRGWSGCGYHHIIRRDGTVEDGRSESTQGAHAKAVNSHSVGVCLVGGMDVSGGPDCNFSFAQFDALDGLLRNIVSRHPTITQIVSHRDVDDHGKTCPNFDASAFAKGIV